MFRSYAQNLEDVILHRALKNVERGFYIDIGAQDPVNDSVSRGFYEIGWRGVHVEANHVYAQALRQARPDEDVFEVFLGSRRGTIPFYEVKDTGLSTGSSEIALEWASRGYEPVLRQVQALGADEFLDQFAGRDIHWMKIDVEGAEAEIIRGWSASDVRPWILVIESIDPISWQPVHEAFELRLAVLGYHFVYFDQLNRFYLHESRMSLKDAFGPGPNVFDMYARVDRMAVAERESLRNEIATLKAALGATASKRLKSWLKRLRAVSAAATSTLTRLLRLDRLALFVVFNAEGQPRFAVRRVLFHRRGEVRKISRRIVFDSHGRIRPHFAKAIGRDMTWAVHPDGAFVDNARKQNMTALLQTAREGVDG